MYSDCFKIEFSYIRARTHPFLKMGDELPFLFIKIDYANK